MIQRNTYPGTTVQICQPLDSEGSFCQSQRVTCCTQALGHACPVNYWFPSIDSDNKYFSSGAPHDPLEGSSCIVQNNPQYSYNYFVNNTGGPDDFRLVYFLERSRSYALGKLTASPCGASIPCQYQIAGYPGGYIDVNP